MDKDFGYIRAQTDLAPASSDVFEGIRKGKGVKKAKGAVPAARRIL